MTLEERINRIICASEIELAGEAYVGKFELGNRKSITSFILNNLRKAYTNFSTGKKNKKDSRDTAGIIPPEATAIHEAYLYP